MKRPAARFSDRIAAVLGECNIAIVTGLAILPLVAGAGFLSDAEQTGASQSAVKMSTTLATVDSSGTPNRFLSTSPATSLPSEPV